jgi:hypothetical protein
MTLTVKLRETAVDREECLCKKIPSHFIMSFQEVFQHFIGTITEELVLEALPEITEYWYEL